MRFAIDVKCKEDLKTDTTALAEYVKARDHVIDLKSNILVLIDESEREPVSVVTPSCPVFKKSYLPKIELPSFCGGYTEYCDFRNCFQG